MPGQGIFIFKSQVKVWKPAHYQGTAVLSRVINLGPDMLILEGLLSERALLSPFIIQASTLHSKTCSVSTVFLSKCFPLQPGSMSHGDTESEVCTLQPIYCRFEILDAIISIFFPSGLNSLMDLYSQQAGINITGFKIPHSHLMPPT